MDNLEFQLSEQLRLRANQGTLRKLTLARSDLKDFTSNDYLGLARSTELADNIRLALSRHSIRNGATGSRLLSGNSSLHEEFEQTLKDTFKAEACLLYNSGYAANTGVLSAIASRNDTILYDERCHASIKDGVRLSLATRHAFKHNDLEDLEQKINRSKGNIFIVVESIYSMDGDLCPLKDVCLLADKYKCFIVLDEAHSTGAVGPDGAGLAVELQVHTKIAVRIYTFGKALGSHGACVAASNTLIQYLINFSKPFIYTTALPDHNIIALQEAFKFLKINPSLQTELRKKIGLFSQSLKKNATASNTAIQTVITGDVSRTRKKAEDLNAKGFDIRPIFSPTVPQGTERLRICLHTFNSDEDIIQLAELLNLQ